MLITDSSLVSNLMLGLDGDGRITGNDATKFFSMSHLSRSELKQVDKHKLSALNVSLFRVLFEVWDEILYNLVNGYFGYSPLVCSLFEGI